MFKLRYEDSMDFYEIIKQFLPKVWICIFAISLVEVIGYIVASIAVGEELNHSSLVAAVLLPTLSNIAIMIIANIIINMLGEKVSPFTQIAIFLTALSSICLNLVFTHKDISIIYVMFTVPILVAVLFIDKKPIIFATLINVSLYLGSYVWVLPNLDPSGIEPENIKELIVLLAFFMAIYAFAQIACVCMTNILDKFIEKHEASQLDSLTKLYNHESFYKRLDRYIQNYYVNNTTFSLIVWDIDNFKSVNDEYGHDVGDDVILAMVSAIKGHLGKGDSAFRYGGEELTLLTCRDARSAKMLSEQVRRTFSTYCSEIEAIDREITACGGICEFSSEYFKGAKDYFAATDDALYKAKRTPGKNTDIIWTAYKKNHINFKIG